jgi:hypothetical protein
MLLSTTPLRVIPNPFAASLAADGRACALVRTDPEHPNAIEYIGAQLEFGTKPRRGNPYGDKVVVRVKRYDLESVELEDTEYHRAKLRSAELIAAEPATAARCGIKFQAPVERLSRAACEVAAATPDVDVEKAWAAQGLEAFLGPAKAAQERARAARAQRIAQAEQAKKGAAPAAQKAGEA